MDLYIIAVVLFSLFDGGHSIKCYQCTDVTGPCVGAETECPALLTACASATVVGYIGNNVVTTKVKSCNSPLTCGNGSVNYGIARETISMKCCNTDLCNSQDVPDSNTIIPNGKQCYYCDGNNCSNKLKCLGTEDYCIKAKANFDSLPATVKGCVSKSVCDITSLVPEGYVDVSCCQGDLCNSAKRFNLNLLLLSWPFFFYTMFHLL
ncbi:urokinase plasminogen activator surface receptor-like [Triplophysa dalaica]|uniref:urokinase plasminogen activator surface receptor-like n=1 Tax=Triplophysa dalaica TaxID=1582913 RepID=UPI0024DF4C98|nr:urokinase plasminogen activator surface receptor-like [Triplophysa dalaica]XP_056587461.1 urokinase plasminogen activator surface receptor-like [Triplophysa dalaica]XP_056587462.1 urokinase plasminogen activator surface receptor-like [Triplophysa dalaica]XP_056587463.1 urokinase plasminogen activator surface receptor-like [Triplophysa dalaica]XP_056587464.1 urokinase plasminogen activator surface receptor-like [Triplophysa dalaica]XP_056587465.1 urokinase plasminogen activator surface recep